MQIKPSTISTAKLKALLPLHLPPIKQVVYLRSYPVNPVADLILREASHLDAFSGYPFQTTADRDRPVSRRSEPSSRAALMGEQPNPWDLIQPQDATSRHRGAEPCRRCELLGKTSLLSPG
jgi:hypothetical protein